jgi:hypothetical protein
MKRTAKKRTDDPGFDLFWERYPRCIDKEGTRKAFDRARTVATLEQILVGLALYPFNRETHLQPHATTWLNQRRWEGYKIVAAPTVQAAPETRTSWRAKYEPPAPYMHRIPTAELFGGPTIEGRLADD